MIKKLMKKNICLLLVLVFASFMMFSCTNNTQVNTYTKNSTNEEGVLDNVYDVVESKVSADYENAERVGDFLFKEENEAGDIKSIVVLADKNIGIKTFTYNALDLDQGYDDVAALTVDFDKDTFPNSADDLVRDDGENIVIKSGGIYLLKGTLNNKRIVIEKGVGERVQLVLNGLKINSNKDEAIFINKDCLAHIHLAKGSENEITAIPANANNGKNKKSIIVAENNLVLNGSGKLIVNSEYEGSIASDENITFISGQYVLNTKGDGIKAKKEIIFKDANIDLNTGDDGIVSTNNNSGMIYIENANIKIKSNDKGVSSDNEILIVGGNVDIDSKNESIGGKIVNLLGGKINLKSGDDGINANDANQNKKANQKDVYIRIMGGEINIDAVMDGIDSNGDLYLEGGKTYISASENDNERIIDYNGAVTCHIGTELIGVGPSVRMQDLGKTPKQSYIIVYYKEKMSADNNIELKDEGNNTILSFKPNKTYKAAIITSANLEVGNNYKIVSGEKELSIKLVEGKNEITE